MTEFLPSLDSYPAFALMVLGFGFIIFVHELGHFLVAKAVGIKVTQFAIGFGPAAIAWRKGIGFRQGSTEPELQRRIDAHWAKDDEARLKLGEKSGKGTEPTAAQIDAAMTALNAGETEYRLNWLPLGGYVKMVGQEDMDPTATSQDPRAFNKKPVWARACVVSAGVIMNVIFAVIFFIIAFTNGVAFPPAVVGAVRPDSPAALAYPVGHANDPEYRGLQPGDQITQIGEARIRDFTDLLMEVALAHPDTTLQVHVERPVSSEPRGVSPRSAEAIDQTTKTETLVYPIQPKQMADTGLLMMGIEQPVSTTIAESKRIELPEALTAAGVEHGMKAVSVDGRPIERFDEIDKALRQANGEPVTLGFEGKKGKTATVTVRAWPSLVMDETSDGGVPHLLGLVPATQVPRVGPGSPAQKAGVRSGDVIAAMNDTPWPTAGQITEIVKASKDKPIAITVLRAGKTGLPDAANTDELITLPPVTPNAQGMLGIAMIPAVNNNIISKTLANSPFATADDSLPPGSRITAINGTAVANFGDMQRLLAAALKPIVEAALPPAPAPAAATSDLKPQDSSLDPSSTSLFPTTPEVPTVSVTYELAITGSPVETIELPLTVEQAKAIVAAQWTLPPALSGFEMLRLPVKADGPIDAAVLGIEKTQQFMVQTYQTLLRLFQGSVPVRELRGPWGIFEAGTVVTRDNGLPYLLFFLGIISVNLAVINFLPLPIVDGGLMVFLIIEKIKGSPVNPKIMAAVNYVGLALFVSLFLMVTYFDLVRG